MIKNTGKVSTDIRRDQIANAALRIIGQKGASGLTTALLAQEAGISEANLYRHFRSKDEILELTVDKIAVGLSRNLQNVFRIRSADPALVKLKRIFTLHLDYVEKNEGIPRLVFSEELHSGNEKLKEKLLTSITAYAAELETFIRQGQRDGFIKKTVQPKAAAFMLIGMVQITILRWSLSGFSLHLVDEGMKLWRNFEACVKTE
ncbi:MAG: TetR/AcrR family transcriptional regulator [Nitrospirae bacterium]|nr:TetR/AcrR family transcriptional regulator [Nitrospirota bacterium]